MPRQSCFVAEGDVFCELGRLDPWSWRWESGERPASAREVSAAEALSVAAESGRMRRVPIGVIGPRDATPAQLETARAVGAGIGKLGLTLICGGKSGVMEAAAEGCSSAGGLTIGMLPDHDWHAANDFIAVPIATGLSEARNMIIAKSSAVLIAVGGSYGTLSEIAYGLHFSKPVICLEGAHAISGTELADRAEDAIGRMAEHLIAAIRLS